MDDEDVRGSVIAALRGSDRFLVQQVFRWIRNEYRISIPAPGSAREGPPLLFVRQSMTAAKEDIRFRIDPNRDQYLFRIKSKTTLEFRGRHDVLDEHDQVIGVLEKDFGKSLRRSHWHVRDPAGVLLFEAYEADPIIAGARRLGMLIPDFDDLSYLKFDFVLARDGRTVGTYQPVLFRVRDRYELKRGPGLAGVDLRLVLALAVGLDALQDR